MEANPQVPYEEIARLRKALAICDVLDFLGHDPSTVFSIKSEDWAGIATLGEVNRPSKETVEMAKDLLRERHNRRLFLGNVKSTLDGRNSR